MVAMIGTTIALSVPANSDTPWDTLWVVLGFLVFFLIVLAAAGVAARLEKRHQ